MAYLAVKYALFFPDSFKILCLCKDFDVKPYPNRKKLTIPVMDIPKNKQTNKQTKKKPHTQSPSLTLTFKF